MDAKDFQKTPSSLVSNHSSPSRNEEIIPVIEPIPIDPNVVQPIPNVVQPIPNVPHLVEPKPESAVKKYPCRYCDKSFTTSMALGGHQNGHKQERGEEKWKALARKGNYFHPYNHPVKDNPSYGLSGPLGSMYKLQQPLFHSPSTGAFTWAQGNSMANMPYSVLGSSSSSSSSADTWRLLENFYANMRKKEEENILPKTSHGMLDLLGPSSSTPKSPKTDDGASGTKNGVIVPQDGDDDNSGLDLELKL